MFKSVIVGQNSKARFKISNPNKVSTHIHTYIQYVHTYNMYIQYIHAYILVATMLYINLCQLVLAVPSLSHTRDCIDLV